MSKKEETAADAPVVEEKKLGPQNVLPGEEVFFFTQNVYTADTLMFNTLMFVIRKRTPFFSRHALFSNTEEK